MRNRRISLTPDQHTLKHDKLRRSIKAGVAALDRGDYTDVEDADLDACLDDLAARTNR
jgi:antitoxin ParD1/3/4